MDFNATSSVESVGSSLTHLSDVATPFNIGYALLGSFAAMQLYQTYRTRGTIAVITEGHSDFIRSHFSANAFLQNARGILTSCYTKYNKATFRVPEMEQWATIINKPELIEEIRKASNERFSFAQAVQETMSARYTLGRDMQDHDYGTSVIQNQLTRSLTTKFEDVCEEIALAFQDSIPMPKDDSEWVAVPALATMLGIVCRASNRIFVGIPMCRDKEWITFNVMHTIDVAKKAQRLRRIPTFLRPIVGNYMLMTDDSMPRAVSMLKPTFEERFRKYDEMGMDWPDKPIDLITWLIEAAPPEESRDLVGLTNRVIGTNFAAIHTTSNTFVHALFHLAAEPKYIATIRAEVEQIIKEDGWTKIAMTKMWKLDSFLKESQRFNGMGLTSLTRKAMKDTILSDGTFIPRGTFVSANMSAIHNDPTLYPAPHEFQPWRFSEMREKSPDDALKHQAVNTAADYLTFGHGRHACPGRFFATNELKAMMAFIVMNYDIRTEEEGVRPSNIYPGMSVLPNPAAKVLFKRRAKA